MLMEHMYNQKTSLLTRTCHDKAEKIEDEAHFILQCEVNQNFRESLFKNIELDDVTFPRSFDEQKLVSILNLYSF